jgi:MOSC domain-containing protein YiiM
MVAQPRIPCYKLGIRFGRSDIVKRFLASQRAGFYFSVIQEGELEVGDSLEVISQDKNQITVTDIVRLYTRESRLFQTTAREKVIASDRMSEAELWLQSLAEFFGKLLDHTLKWGWIAQSLR